MAIKGLSIPVFGKYNFADGVVTYTDGMINPHAVSYTVSIESTENNPCYGDNKVVENDVGKFSTGTYGLETDDLTQETSKFILGIKEIERSYGDGKKTKALIYDDDQEAPELGCGIIEEHQNDDVDQYKTVILKRVVFNIPEDAATTRKGSIEWQTKSIEGTIMRSEVYNDDEKYPWKEEAWFASEGEALAYLKVMLGVADAV